MKLRKVRGYKEIKDKIKVIIIIYTRANGEKIPLAIIDKYVKLIYFYENEPPL